MATTPFRSVDPATEELLQEFEPLDGAALEARVARAEHTFAEGRHGDLSDRTGPLRDAAELLESGAAAYGRLITQEMGKPVEEAEAEVEKCAWLCRHYADRADDYLADETVATDHDRTRVRHRPLGPVLAVMPWNFPFWQVFRFAAPALAAGNVVLLKHAPNVPQCALAVQGVFRRAGFPEGAFQNLFVDADRVGDLLGDPRVRGVTLTGSVEAGRAVAREAGSRVKKTVLELGGSDPFVVMPSADLDRALEDGVAARTRNNGQSCIAAKRFVLHEEIADEFVDRLVGRIEALEVGSPLDTSVDVGPLAREDLRDRLDRQVRETVDAGARLLAGGGVPDRPGWFYEPAVLDRVPDGSPAATEELFGPAVAVFRVPDARTAVERANRTRFGLGASAWTRDPDERELFLDGLEAGTVAINAMVASDPRVPFGGVKASGYGRELGRRGIREFTNVQTVHLNEG
jgi:succinate-semialdehyde dehydrogenase/glutarate-semialdehyde dehydrogenase